MRKIVVYKVQKTKQNKTTPRYIGKWKEKEVVDIRHAIDDKNRPWKVSQK